MKLSLSVRIVESTCKTRLQIPFREFVAVAKSSGYDAICMRASAGGVDSPKETLTGLRAIVEDAGLRVSMVTADVNVPLNNDRGPDSLRNIGPSRHRASPRRRTHFGLPRAVPTSYDRVMRISKLPEIQPACVLAGEVDTRVPVAGH